MLRSTVLLALSLASLAHEETELLQINVNEIASLKSVATSVSGISSVTSSVTSSITVPSTKVLTDLTANTGSTLKRVAKQAAAVETLTTNSKEKVPIWDSIKSTFHSGWQTVKSWCGFGPEDNSPEAKAKKKQEEAEEARKEKELEEKCKNSPDAPECESWADSIGSFFGFGGKKKKRADPRPNSNEGKKNSYAK